MYISFDVQQKLTINYLFFLRGAQQSYLLLVCVVVCCEGKRCSEEHFNHRNVVYPEVEIDATAPIDVHVVPHTHDVCVSYVVVVVLLCCCVADVLCCISFVMVLLCCRICMQCCCAAVVLLCYCCCVVVLLQLLLCRCAVVLMFCYVVI